VIGRALAIVVAGMGAVANAGLLFLAAGRSDLFALQAYALLWGVFLIGSAVASDPELVHERLHPGPGARESLLVATLIAAGIWLSHLLVAGLDVGRMHWSDSVPRALQLTGFAGLAGSLALGQWASRANPFFSSVVRIQNERGHRVISTGPYRYVRHPGYASAVVMVLSSGLALGSWLSLAPSAFAIAALVIRTQFEERVLCECLPGYEAYARRVAYRLLPGVW
jgi:protein-S-isoprenylcysteine O-methyltransferase Ste14